MKPQTELSEPALSMPSLRRAERRWLPRHIVIKPIMAIPVLPGGEPDVSSLAEGFSLDISAEGIGMQLGIRDKLPSKNLVVGVEADDGKNYFATIEVRRVAQLERGIQLGGQFIGAGGELFRGENLSPRLDPRTTQFTTGLPPEALAKWAELGVVCTAPLDRFYTCPECHSLPTFRRGCKACGSSRVQGSELLHHFACAHVGLAAEFERGSELVCPKCRMRRLVVGADFEHVPGPFRCGDCGWSDTELEEVGQCLGCGLRFPLRDAREQTLIGYHVDRLDPLALIGAR